MMRCSCPFNSTYRCMMIASVRNAVPCGRSVATASDDTFFYVWTETP